MTSNNTSWVSCPNFHAMSVILQKVQHTGIMSEKIWKQSLITRVSYNFFHIFSSWYALAWVIFTFYQADQLANEEWMQNVINNLLIVDWIFTKRLESFTKHWLYDTLKAELQWYRYDYQVWGSIDCHGTAKLRLS